MANSLRKREDQEDDDPATDGVDAEDHEYLPYGAVDRWKWVKYWKEFQRLAYAVSRDGQRPYAVKFDIANFYDSVGLALLENKLRHACAESERGVINLLMIFLASWNRHLEGYGDKRVGIPMDIIGDCSRILANFFLQSYDGKMADYVNVELDGRYLRYADDQLILLPMESDRADALIRSGIELHRIGLSINSGKVLTFDSLEDYDHYWCFSLIDEIGDGKCVEQVNTGTARFITQVECQDDNRPWRTQTVLRRLLTVSTTAVASHLREALVAVAKQDEYLMHLNARHLGKIYELMSKESQDLLIGELIFRAANSPYTEFVLSVREFLASVGQQQSQYIVNERLAELKSRYQTGLN